MKRFATRVLGKVLTPLALAGALMLPLAQPAHAQFPFPFPPATGAPAAGNLLFVPADLLSAIQALNPQININVINNIQIGNNNVAIIAVNQGNLKVPAGAVGSLFQFNLNVINNVQIGENNVAVITVGQSNVAAG